MPNEKSSPWVSVYLITRNEEHNLERTLESVTWADEIIVVDSGSTDSTLEIAKKYGAKTEVRKFNGFIEQKNVAMDLCSGEWLLNIDADEEVSTVLSKSIRMLTAGQTEDLLSVYEVCRKTQYLGRWIEHCGWYPEYRGRLSRKNMARWEGDLVHERLVGTGGVGRLKGDLLHRPYRDLGDHIGKIERYASLFAEREGRKGRRARFSDLLFRPVVRFIKMYVLKAGFLDGMPGLVASVMGGWYVFMKYARLYESARDKHDDSSY